MLIGFIYPKTSLSILVIKLDIAILRLPAKRLNYCTVMGFTLPLLVDLS